MKRRHAVRHRLDAGHRGAAVGKRRQQQQRRQGVLPRVGRQRHIDRHDAAGEIPVQAGREQQRNADHEEIGRHGEDVSRLADAAQVADGEDREKPEAPLDTIGVELRKRGRNRQHTGRDAHRDRQRVVDEQRRGGDQSGVRADVLLGDDVGAAAVGYA
jgi:hypothetical protein